TLLLHATLALLGSLLLRVRSCPAVRSTFAVPLGESALLSTFLALPLLVLPVFEGSARGQVAILAVYTGWLAALWLAAACCERWPALFAGFQAALSLAVCYAVTGWLDGQEFVRSSGAGLLDPRSLHAYGIGLAALA